MVKKPEIHPELTSVISLNPLHRGVSASRAAMFSGNLSQFLAVNGAMPRRLMGGMERRFGEATFGLEFKDNVEIIKVIPRFIRGAGVNPIRKNPRSVIIYENWQTKEIGMLDWVDHNCLHQHFGFEYTIDPDVRAQLVPGKTIPAGTKLGRTPLLDINGNYCYGMEANVALFSDPATTEDGIKVSESFLKRVIPTGFETQVIEFGKHMFPINLYGGPGEVKLFPDIGERIHSHGLLFALRRYDELMGVTTMTESALRSTDYIFDHKVYGEPDAEVVDIKVIRNDTGLIPPMPYGMEDQLLKYYEADQTFYKSILDVWLPLYRRRGKSLHLEPEFHRLVVEAIDRVGAEYVKHGSWLTDEKLEALKVSKVYRDNPIDAWRVEITYKYHSIPNVGFKLTDTDGDKGVVVRVTKDEDMPIDANGNRADFVMSQDSRVRRLTPAAFIEQYVNAAGRDTIKRIQTYFGFDFNAVVDAATWEDVIYNPRNKEAVDRAFSTLMHFYEITVPLQHAELNDPEFHEENPDFRRDHVYEVLIDSVYYPPGDSHPMRMAPYQFSPIDNPVHIPDMIRRLRDEFPAVITPVEFAGYDDVRHTSKSPVLIGHMYVMVLEKTAEDWMAVASAKLQTFGTTARLNNRDKHSAPGRQNVTRTIGESELRLLAAAIGPDEVADIMDATNNPQAHKAIQRAILTAEKPTDIDVALDRNEIPLGGHRPQAYLRHVFECSGKTFSNE